MISLPRRHQRTAATVGLIAGIAVAAGVATHQRTSASPAASIPVIVELFTSEGCSSCPPADQLLTELVTQQPVPGATVIGLSEHVDYWNNLGWKDPFSSAAFTTRQSGFAAAAGSGDVYTPQMIVNGTDAVIGSDRTAALAAIRKAIDPGGRPPGSTSGVALDCKTGDTLEIAIAPTSRAVKGDVRLAITEDGLASSVKRGENAGHMLTHTGVTRRLIQIGTLKADGSFHDVRKLDLDPSWHRQNLHVVVFVQRGDAGAIVASQITSLAR